MPTPLPIAQLRAARHSFRDERGETREARRAYRRALRNSVTGAALDAFRDAWHREIREDQAARAELDAVKEQTAEARAEIRKARCASALAGLLDVVEIAASVIGASPADRVTTLVREITAHPAIPLNDEQEAAVTDLVGALIDAAEKD